LILVTFFVSFALSQNDTNHSNVNSSIIEGKLNKSRGLTVI